MQQQVKNNFQLFQRDTTVRFNLNKYTSKRSMLNNLAFQNDKSIKGTNTAAAISQMRNQVLSRNNGDRSEVRNLMILMTDGQSNINTQGTLQEAALARSEGTQVLAVGIGSNVNRQEVEGITSDSSRVFYASNQNELENIANRIIDFICVDL